MRPEDRRNSLKPSTSASAVSSLVSVSLVSLLLALLPLVLSLMKHGMGIGEYWQYLWTPTSDDARYRDDLRSTLPGIATLILAFAGMKWLNREPPPEPSEGEDWFRGVIDDYSRENVAFLLILLLSSLYGDVVWAYALLVLRSGSPDGELLILYILLMLYLGVSMMPSFVVASSNGVIQAFARGLASIDSGVRWSFHWGLPYREPTSADRHRPLSRLIDVFIVCAETSCAASVCTVMLSHGHVLGLNGSLTASMVFSGSSESRV